MPVIDSDTRMPGVIWSANRKCAAPGKRRETIMYEDDLFEFFSYILAETAEENREDAAMMLDYVLSGDFSQEQIGHYS
jgi:hypothetical protein